MTDRQFLEELLDAEIDPRDVLSLIDAWLNGDSEYVLDTLAAPKT